MSFPKCRGKSNRMNLTKTYDVTPVAHVMLLPGQKFEGCCEVIETECYTFSYANKSDLNDIGLFHVGKHCANDFINFSGKVAPPLFNPLTSVGVHGRSGTGIAGGGGVASVLCPLNKEIYEAISILTLAWGPPRAPLQKFLTHLSINPSVPMSHSDVQHLNNIIGKIAGRTLTKIIAQLGQGLPNIRAFTFPLVGTILAANAKPNNF
ncbi:hypothetical protein [Collimonas fungivorans]|uniref:hypothetical protein n=1 Tax=Collimonas fungivorans TaxID=158899 RepID=UPI0011D22B64|nr:hypothetical protein [Collimonas fungivorans]